MRERSMRDEQRMAEGDYERDPYDSRTGPGNRPSSNFRENDGDNNET